MTCCVVLLSVSHFFFPLLQMEAGFTRRSALLFNLLSSLPAFLGLIIAVPLSGAAGAQLWILSIAAGGFLYIGFGTLIPELQKSFSHLHTIFCTVAMFVGFLILILLSVYEERLVFALCVK